MKPLATRMRKQKSYQRDNCGAKVTRFGEGEVWAKERCGYPEVGEAWEVGRTTMPQIPTGDTGGGAGFIEEGKDN